MAKLINLAQISQGTALRQNLAKLLGVADVANIQIDDNIKSIKEQITEVTGEIGDKGTLQSQIDTLSNRVGSTDVPAQITAAINNLDATVTSADVTTGAVVEVVEADGKLTGVTVTNKDIASAATLAEVKATVGTKADGAEVDTVYGKIAKAQAAADAAKINTVTLAGSDATVTGSFADNTLTLNDVASKTNLDKLTTKVGVVPATVGEVATETVVAYVDAKVAAANTATNTAISNLDATVTSDDVTTGVVVEVAEVDGKLTGVTVTHKDIASAAEVARIAALHVEGKTVAQEAADAVAKVVDGADSAFDTLKEVANWINDSDAAAAGFNAAKRIVDLETKVGVEAVESNPATGLIKDVRDLQAAVGAGGSVETQITNAINNLDSEKASTNGQFVNVTVTQTDGKVTGVSVAENNIASADALAKLQAVVGYSELGESGQDALTVKARLVAAETSITTLEGDGVGSVNKALADAKAYTDTLAKTMAFVVDKVAVSTSSAVTAFTLSNVPNANKVKAYINNLVYTEGEDFTVDRASRVVTWTFTAAAGGFDINNVVTDAVHFEYYTYVIPA